jgi:hypothetical protein
MISKLPSESKEVKIAAPITKNVSAESIYDARPLIFN